MGNRFKRSPAHFHPTRDRPAIAANRAGAEGSAAGDRGGRAPLSSAGRCYGSLLQLGEAEHVLLLTMHHIVSDLWSMGILIRELAALMKPLHWEVLTASGTVYPVRRLCCLQRQWLQERHQTPSYWKQLWRSSVLELPTDRPRPLQPTLGETIVAAAQRPERGAEVPEQREGATLYEPASGVQHTALLLRSRRTFLWVRPLPTETELRLKG